MAFGEAAAKTLEMAHNAYKASIETAQSVRGFAAELERQDRRTNEQLLAQERRLIDKLAEFSSTFTEHAQRFRELERENAELRGKVASLEHLRELEGKHATLQGQVIALEARVNTLVLEAIQSALRANRLDGHAGKTDGAGTDDAPLFRALQK